MRKKLLIIFGTTGLIAILVAGAFLSRYQSFLSTPTAPPAAVEITIERGDSFKKVAGQLHRHKIVSDLFFLELLARREKIATRIKAGDYRFETKATPGEVLKRLVDGDIVLRQLTLPEGLTVREIARRMAEEKLTEEKAVIDLAFNAEFVKKLGVEAGSLEGYLFPETYSFPKKTTTEEFLKMMVDMFRAKLSQDILNGAKERNLSPHQLVILASIIQKESGNREEMPLISAVFHNRLKRGIALQADPTVIYGIKDFDGNLTRKHLRTSTPYNTYTKRGLPAGPIANPGLEALSAAAFPADVTYLYFVSRGDGTHLFSKTLREHNRAVLKYQKRRRGRTRK
jgi:peptidoglycan lytic transglycosylase G